MDEDLRDIARRFLTAKETDDWDGLRRVTADELFIGHLEVDPGDLLDAFGDGRWDQLAPIMAEYFTPNGDWVEIETAIETRQHWRSHHSHHDLSIEHISVSEDDRVTYLIETTEIHDGMYYGYEPTGDEITVQELGVLKIEDGVVRHQWNTWSLDEFLEQMGIRPGSGTVAKIEKQFYKVVNRVLRHNLRTDLNAISGYADLMTVTAEGADDHVERLIATSDGLVNTVEKVRELEQRILNAQDSHVVDIESVLLSIVESQRDEHSDAEINIRLPEEPMTLISNRSLVELAVREAIENALAHNDASDPMAEVSLRPVDKTDDAVDLTLAPGTEYAVTISIADNGPGIPDHEITPLREERETSLEHASGLGLWAIKWSIERLGGEVEIDENHPRGSVVTMNIPDQPLEEAK